MNRRQLIAVGVGSFALSAFPSVMLAAPALPLLEVYKSPHCGCCGAWVDHMKAAGFPAKVHLVDDTTAARKRLGMPDRFGSCHTAVVGGYVVEGHVPAEEVKRLLALKPAAIGLAVPSMPPGSPGMEMGDRRDPYQVLLIDRNGRETVFASYPKA
jgi:hypothetical protein